KGYWEQVWNRFLRDKVAIGGGVYVILLILVAFVGAPIAKWLLGHGPGDLFQGGVDSQLGRDEFLRLLYGAQVSLEIAVGATLLGMTIGVLMGAAGGYFGGWSDTLVSRLTEIVMAFPYLLFVIALASTVGDRLDSVTFGFL